MNGTFQRKFRKQGGRKFEVDRKLFIHNQLKEPLDRLLLGALKNTRLGFPSRLKIK
jgi:hypothetical protein